MSLIRDGVIRERRKGRLGSQMIHRVYRSLLSAKEIIERPHLLPPASPAWSAQKAWRLDGFWLPTYTSLRVSTIKEFADGGRRVEGVQIERTADEILALKEGSLEAHAINQSAAVVYDLCDGNTSKSDMAAEIHRRTGLPADDEIVDLALSELVETGLVLLDDPESRSAVTRRALIRRLALSSTLALMLPVVETVVVPPAEAQPRFSTPMDTPTPTPTSL